MISKGENGPVKKQSEFATMINSQIEKKANGELGVHGVSKLGVGFHA